VTSEPGGLRTRRDALRMLDSVCEFLERSEPSNPAPLLIRRAQRLIGSGFLDIMRDMAPESLGHIEIITGQGHSQHDSETAQ
jgi:type VI secretion system protein ImpA